MLKLQPWRARAIGLTLLLLLLAPSAALACAIDNTASVSADGVRAQLTTAAPTDPNRYAPFTFT